MTIYYNECYTFELVEGDYCINLVNHGEKSFVQHNNTMREKVVLENDSNVYLFKCTAFLLRQL
jgi:hypothetical protein